MNYAENLINLFQALVDMDRKIAELQSDLEADQSTAAMVCCSQMHRLQSMALENFRGLVIKAFSARDEKLIEFVSQNATYAALAGDTERSLRSATLMNWIKP